MTTLDYLAFGAILLTGIVGAAFILIAIEKTDDE